MRSRNLWLGAACVAMFLVATVVGAPAQNVLNNPGFEDGPAGGGARPTGWIFFGNAFQEPTVPPQFEPYEGDQLVSMFGNFSGGFNVTGVFQEFPTHEGAPWQLSSKSRHWSGDALVGIGPASCGEFGCTDNWVVQKIAWFNAAGEEIGGVESKILDGTFATDVWHENAPILGFAPPGAVKLQALILYLQPLFDGGASHIDNVDLRKALTLDIRPGSCPNPLNLKLFDWMGPGIPNKGGVLPVAIFGSSTISVEDIDVSTILLEGVAPLTRGMGPTLAHLGAPSGDGCECSDMMPGADDYLDLELKFSALEIAAAIAPAGAAGEERTLTLTGQLLDGRPFALQDCIRFVGTPGRAPDAISLSSAYPNPFNPVTRISYTLPAEAYVDLAVYDVQGKLVERVVTGVMPSGEHVVEWDAKDSPSGVYFFNLRVGDRQESRRVVLLK